MTSDSTPAGKPLATQIRQGLLLLSLTYLGLVAVSYFISRGGIQERYQALAEAAAKSIFDTTMAARVWNAGHGGIYVPVSERIQPNSYLEDPQRDLVTTDGMLLTKLNPSFMTRLLAETIAARSGIGIHLTSLHPLRPENGPDPWEAEALRTYAEQGRPSRLVTMMAGEPVFRYLEGMRVEEPCLACHAGQGYRTGDPRGGISVTIPYRRYVLAGQADRRNLLLLHSIFLLLGLGSIWLVGWRLLASSASLEESRARVRTLEELLPICSYCKKIRREGGNAQLAQDWQPFESYLSTRIKANFSHGICPECLEKHHPEVMASRHR